LRLFEKYRNACHQKLFLMTLGTKACLGGVAAFDEPMPGRGGGGGQKANEGEKYKKRTRQCAAKRHDLS
jgi:hypothetical protein